LIIQLSYENGLVLSILAFGGLLMRKRGLNPAGPETLHCHRYPTPATGSDDPVMDGALIRKLSNTSDVVLAIEKFRQALDELIGLIDQELANTN
jgi:hypothetical protein